MWNFKRIIYQHLYKCITPYSFEIIAMNHIRIKASDNHHTSNYMKKHAVVFAHQVLGIIIKKRNLIVFVVFCYGHIWPKQRRVSVAYKIEQLKRRAVSKVGVKEEKVRITMWRMTKSKQNLDNQLGEEAEKEQFFFFI